MRSTCKKSKILNRLFLMFSLVFYKTNTISHYVISSQFSAWLKLFPVHRRAVLYFTSSATPVSLRTVEKSILATASDKTQGGKKEGKKEKTGELLADKHRPRPLIHLLMKTLRTAGHMHCSSPQAVADVPHVP